MKWRKLYSIKGKMRKAASCALATTVLASSAITCQAAEVKTITSMQYASVNDGPVLSQSGVGAASYGFVMPIFNDGTASWEDVVGDLKVNVKVNGQWVDIDTVSEFVYNYNWGHWSDSGFYGYWFMVDKTTEIQLQSISNPGVTLDYTLEFTQLSEATISSMVATQGPELTVGPTGTVGFTYPTFNGDANIKYEQVAKDLKVYVRTQSQSDWVDIDNNAASGWIYDQNFGQFYDGPGGYWFTVTETTYVRLVSKSNPNVYVDYTLNYSTPERNAYVLSAPETTFTAGETGAIGLPLPMIDGSYAVQSELDNFVYEIEKDGQWVELSNAALSGFSYQGNGYNSLSDKNQWGYWVDSIYGLWFQPIQEDMKLRIGYPTNGQKGGAIDNNYIVYQFIGNPNAVRPDISDLGNIELGTSSNAEIEGWDLIWNDEFSGDKLNEAKWNYSTGYYIDDDPNKWGWGNNELEYYTTSDKNVYVKDGVLNLTALYEPTTFPEIDPNREAPYSSGKVTTQNKFAVKYGRVDFRAKLPTGNGIWPALWLLPNDSEYGVWAASGEIDVMEARGRIPNSTCGTIHYGGAWPANTYLGSDFIFPEGQTIDSDYHVYSVVWEEDNIKWYVDGECFFKATNEQWYSLADTNNINAPFDKEFYLIMNVAVGGWFDGGITPEAGDIPATMNVDYVRVYQNDESSKNGSYTDRTQGVEIPSTPVEPEIPETPVEPETPNVPSIPSSPTDQVGNEVCGLTGTGDTVEFYVNGATFADVHYSINNGAQQNCKMESVGDNQYRYTVSGLTAGDTIEYFFTYNPGDGALDTEKATYTVSGNDSSDSDKDSEIVTPVKVGDETCGLVWEQNTVEFYVNGATFADVHYSINNGGQQNCKMEDIGDGQYRYTVPNVGQDDEVEYFFTYDLGSGALDTQKETFVASNQ